MKRILASLVLFATFSHSVFAATFTVNDTGDGSDFLAGDAICEVTSGGGDCTFRAAVEEANTLAGADAIEFSGATSVVSTAPYTITQEVSINTVGNQDVEIVGAGVASPSGALNVTGAADNVTINNIDVSQFNGIGVRLGGTNGTLQNSQITAQTGDGVRIDGITANTVDNNEISGNGGNGININAGSDGTVTITNNKIGVEDTGSGYNVQNHNGSRGIFSSASGVDDLNINDNIIGASPNESIRISAPTDTPNINIDGNNIGLGEDGVTNVQGSGLMVDILNIEDANNVTISNNAVGNSDLSHGIVVNDSTGIVSILDNFVGLGADGLTPAEVDADGITVNGGDEIIIDGNTLGNVQNTGIIALNSDDITVSNNKVGFGTDGSTGASVYSQGILVESISGVGVVEIVGNQVGNILEKIGIRVRGNPLSLLIEDNLIGLENDGITAAGIGNGVAEEAAPVIDAGILIESAVSVLIQGNVVAAIFGDGIRIIGGTTVDIFDNMIGTSSDGLSPVGLSGAGIAVVSTDTTDLNIGDFDQGNVISTNGGTEGILVQTLNSSAATVDIKGNYIGTNLGATEITDYENGNDGMEIKMGDVTIGGDSNFNGELGAGPVIGEGNVISNNGGRGVYLAAVAPADISNVDILGNIIGAYDPLGDDSFNGDAGNTGAGIGVNGAINSTVNIGSGSGLSADSQRNIISGNDTFGINVQSNVTFLNIFNNFIGLALDGVTGLGNSFSGIQIEALTSGSVNIGDGSSGNGNVIGANGVSGIYLYNFATGVTVSILGNYIGIASDGTTAVGNNTTDGTFAGGITVQQTSDAEIFIGDEKANTAERNVISGNTGAGIYIDGTDDNVEIKGNYIGTNAAGTAAIPNTDGTSLPTQLRGAGIAINDTAAASENITIGDLSSTKGNVISGNSGAGIAFLADAAGFGIIPGPIINNFIGVAANGTSMMANGDRSVLFDGSLSAV